MPAQLVGTLERNYYRVGVSVNERASGRQSAYWTTLDFADYSGDLAISGIPMQADWQPGDLAESMNVGWQEFAVLSPGSAGPGSVNTVPKGVPEQATLGWLGMPGLTAYIGLTEIGRPLPGETRLRHG